MTHEQMNDDQLPVAYEPNFEELEKTTSEAPYMEAAFYLLREATHWLTILAGLKPPSPLKRNDAILRGLLVRVVGVHLNVPTHVRANAASCGCVEGSWSALCCV
ncbi:hypothetical protein, partial [Streptomyces canus]|uniref:hypothetical protein n=1 Tax=Streptomyces canus TaxID=58343 RepID=UPI001BC8B4B7